MITAGPIQGQGPKSIPDRGAIAYATVALPTRLRYSFTVTYTDFTATDRWTKKQVHCLYKSLIVAIATRHADAIDVNFVVDGRAVSVVLPHPAWVEYKKRTGKVITDPMAIAIAGQYLKRALESGEGVGRAMYALTVDETLKNLDAVVNEAQEATPAAAH